MKKIFYNVAEGQIRAGWRMAMYVGLLLGLNYAATPTVRFCMARWPGIPNFLIAEFFFYGLTTLVTYGVLRFIDQRPFRSVGLVRHGAILKETGKGLLIGGGMMTLIFIVEYSAGWVNFSFKPLSAAEVGEVFSVSILIFVVGAYGEELLFRGYLFQTMTEGAGKIIAVAFFAVLFGLMHSSNPHVTVLSIINVALAGIWLSIAYYKTKALWFPIALHFSWNFFENHIYSFPVSGLHFEHYQLGTIVQSGSPWITGGEFGPEGGILATIVVVVTTVWIYYAPWLRPSENVWSIEQWREKKMPSTSGSVPISPPSTGETL